MVKSRIIIDKLPEGVRVGERPDHIEFYRRGRGTADKWVPYVHALKVLKATETIQIDLSTSSDIKKAVVSIRAGVNKTAKEFQVKHVKYALIGKILHMWV